MTKLILVAAAAIINSEGRILLAQRPQGKPMSGLWEFPGGKIETGETPEIALARELYEELRIGVDPKQLKPITFASHRYEEFHLLMPLFELKEWADSPESAEGQTLAWVYPRELHRYPSPEADVPLFKFLVNYMKGENR